jgi:hypothetical protein
MVRLQSIQVKEYRTLAVEKGYSNASPALLTFPQR